MSIETKKVLFLSSPDRTPSHLPFAPKLTCDVRRRQNGQSILEKGADDRKTNECKKILRNAQVRNKILFW